MKTTGFSSAGQVPVGAVLTAAIWTLTDTYLFTVYPSMEAALEAGIARTRSRVEQIPGHHEHMSIELRWELRYPDGGGTLEAPIERYSYDSIQDAVDHLERCRRFSPNGHPSTRLDGKPIDSAFPSA